MTMQMPRDPLSEAYPAAQVIEILTAEGAAEVVDRSPSTIRDWADSNLDACPNARQIKALDRACVQKKGVAPFADWARRCKLEEKAAESGGFLSNLLKVGAAFGKLSTAAQEVDGVAKLNAAQRESITRVYGEFRQTSVDLESCITRMQKRDPVEVD